MKGKMKGSSLRAVVATLAGLCMLAVAAIVGLPGTAVATPGFQFNSETLARSFFEGIDVVTHGKNDFRVMVKVRDPADVYVVRNRVPPGGHSGWHTHPGPSIVSVKTGMATVYSGDDPSCSGVDYPAGTGFIDEGGGHAHMVRNQGTVELEVVAFQIVPMGADRRIDLPDPGFCPF